MRTLVVLGGADGSVSVYQRARELGYRTICVDVRPGAPGVLHADEFVQLSVRAPERIAAALDGRTDIVGVLCPASDVGLPTQAWLSRHWGLPSPLPEAAVRASVDKPVFRALCDQLGLPSYRCVSGAPDADLISAATGLRFPTLVKPVDSSGSRGVVACPGPGALRSSFAESVEFSPSGRIVVEEHLDGSHYTVEVLVRHGKVAFHAVTERTITPPPYFVTTSHLLPAELPAAVDAELVETLEAICAELGYTDGPLTLDAVLGRDGRLYLIEMGARMGGNGLAEVIESCYGVDLMAATIAVAVGDDPVLTPHPPVPTLVHVLGSDRPGCLGRIEGIDDVLGIPGVVDLRLFAEEGDFVRAYEQAGYKLGYVVLTASSVPELLSAENAVRGTLKFRLEAQDMAVPQP
ncbi:carbamoyl phosphate synthase [Amycolatopsis antarctica]|uniref:Carbamoyl phosphate synthase n=1 Tax=Amycolatopsis antarctica TaxID=1854586 RepID=A0A263D948_9PSEU|nr:ATP-grasp domain-containing protein [Amycolatopsis antarctica]OZM75034.1 carbamoyl phosphate synthase [Amycolatopsis antarctica]